MGLDEQAALSHKVKKQPILFSDNKFYFQNRTKKSTSDFSDVPVPNIKSN